MSAEFRDFQTLKSTGRILRLREKDFCFLCPFLFKGRFLSGEETRDFDTGRNFPFWGITFRDAGDMKFPPETGIQQENRKNLYTVLGLDGPGAGYPLRVKLVHSKKVFYCSQKKGTFPENLGEGDGIICNIFLASCILIAWIFIPPVSISHQSLSFFPICRTGIRAS